MSWLFDDENWDCIIQKLTQEALSKVTRGQRLNDDLEEGIRLFRIVINQLKIGEDFELASMLFRAAIGSELLQVMCHSRRITQRRTWRR